MYQRILVPFDGSSTSRLGLAEAIKLARLTHGRIKLMYVVDELALYMAAESSASVSSDYLTDLLKDGERLLAEAMSVAVLAGIETETLLCDNFNGSVHELVNAEAASWPADVIVIGTHGRRGVGRVLMGSSAEKVLRHADVPVLLIRAPADKPAAAGPETSFKVRLPTAALHIE